METILLVPLHLQSPPLKSSGQPLQYELSKSNVPTFAASNHGRQRGLSVVKPQTPLSPSNAPSQGCRECHGLSSWLNSHDRARRSQSTRFPSLNCARTQQHLEISYTSLVVTKCCLVLWHFPGAENWNLVLQEPIQSVTFSYIIKRDARQIHASWTSWSSPHLTAQVNFIGYWLQMVWKQVYDLVNNSSDMLWQIFKPSFSFCMYKPKNITTHWNREVSNTKRCCETEEIALYLRWKVTQLYKEMPFWVLQQGNTYKTLREQWKSQTKSQAPCFLHSYPSCSKHRICLLCAKTETCTSKSKTSRSLIKRCGSATQTVAKVRAPEYMKIHLSVI